MVCVCVSNTVCNFISFWYCSSCLFGKGGNVLDSINAFVFNYKVTIVFYYCPLNMFLCRIIRFLAKDKPPLKR